MPKVKLSKLITMVFFGIFEYILGNICAILLYRKKYIGGKYFRGSRLGFLKIGWGWAISDFNARLWLKINRGVPFPISPRNHINNPHNIYFDSDDLLIFQGQGKYFQAVDAPIYIGKGCYIADNVGVITTNHNVNELEKHDKGKEIIIGEKSWIGMNSMILPGVKLGKKTIVGAGSVVTKSFPQGHCIIAGNPAKIIKSIEEGEKDENI